MSPARKVVVIGGSVVAVAAIVVAVVFGVIGITQTVIAGTQPTVCGVKLGVTSTNNTVRLLGASDGRHSPGDRVRLSALCMVEIVAIDDISDASDDDGAAARVQLRWRLW